MDKMPKREVYSYIMNVERKTRIFKLRTLMKDFGIKPINTTSQVLDRAIETCTIELDRRIKDRNSLTLKKDEPRAM